MTGYPAANSILDATADDEAAATHVRKRLASGAGTPDASGCTVWTLGPLRCGYGRLYYGGKRYAAHRAAYEMAFGRIAPGVVLDHLCGNRACVNLEHLEPVTQLVNVGRGDTGQHNASKTHCKRGHEFTPENTIHIPAGRRCRACQRQRSRESDRRRASITA